LWTIVEAAILVGGRARRFGGRDKSRLRVGSTTILDRQLAVVGPLADRVFIVASDSRRVDARGLTVVLDRMPGTGTLGAVYTALSASTGDFTLVVACDMPFLSGPFLAHMASVATGDVDVVIPRTVDGYQPLCALYARRSLRPIRRRIEAGRLKVLDLLADLRVREIGAREVARYDPDGTLFLNVNTPEDYRRALTLASQRERRVRERSHS
jgi:molybdopterin-guanine dinucleotide biosynthesis protein A